MRPLRLSMQAFGPYSRRSEIDFTSLARGGLFLIHGQTGAGKTSILDGICFALFGTSSGADRPSEGLRSDLAVDTLPTEVVFELSLGTDTYRVVRRPKQLLKRQRGEGLGEQKPKGELWKLAGEEWELLASGDRKTDERIGELIGMTEEQFRQVVVLPQGQFRKFLSASSDAREKLLETLFRTEKFRKLAEHLGEKSSALAAEIGAQKQALAAQLASLEISGPDELEARLSEAAGQAARLAGSATDLEARVTAAHERWRVAQRRAQASQEFATLQTREAALNERAGEIRDVSDKLERDRRSRPVLAVDASIVQNERDLARIGSARVKERQSLEAAERQLALLLTRRLELEARAPEIEKLKAEQQSLREIYAAAKRLKTEQEGLDAVELAAASARKKVDELEEKITTTRAARTAVAEKIQALEPRAAKLDALRLQRGQQQNEAELLQEVLREIEQAGFQLEREESFRAETHAAWEAERAALTKLRIKYHLSQASRLAAELADGSPCPVCGSTDHPRPATLDDDPDAVTPETIENAELTEKRAADRHTRALARATSAGDEVAKVKARLARRFGAEPDLVSRARFALEQASKAIDELDKAIRESEDALELLRASQARVVALDRDLLRLDTELRAAAGAREESGRRLDKARTVVEELLQQVPPERRDLATITARGQALALQTDTFAKELSNAVEAHQQALQAATAARANIETLASEMALKTSELAAQGTERAALLESSGFASLEECRAAGLQATEARALEEKRRAYDNERAIVLSRSKELAVELAAFEPWAADLDARAAEHKAVDAERTETRGQALAIKERITLLEAARVRIGSLTKGLTALEEKYKVIGRLGSVASGQPPHNLSRVNFARFVLASRLDDVLELASRRLYSMSRGQFTLKRALAGADKRKSAGLDLEVEDSHSGSLRPTSSLSGGEGFMASLCLALGLADVVQNELGGVRLDAVFVDEGFGTLDSEALELAMKTLGELQAGGRIVGVISHVPELKEQIARRLLVRKTPEGSHVGWETML